MTAVNLVRLTGVNSSLALKAPVRCATTGPITLSGLQTIDGVTFTQADVAFPNSGTNKRVLVKNQADATTNGIYDINTGAWTRSGDFVSNNDFVQGTRIFVSQGATQQATTWYLSTADPITLNTSAFVFTAVPIANLAFADGTAASPSFSFAADPATGFYRPGASQIGITLGGTSAAIFKTTGLTLTVPLGVLYGGTGTATQFTQGSIAFAGPSGVYSQDNAKFFWDDSNLVLGLSTATPSNIGGTLGLLAASGLQNITVTPVGNASGTLSSLVMQAADVGGGTGYEYATVISITTTHNTGSVAPNKVAGYFAATNNNATGGNIWSLNSVNTLGGNSPSGVSSTGYEIDVNNVSGTARNYFNLGAPSYGLQITGVSTSVNTAAILLSGNPGAPQWTAGIVWNNFRSAQSTSYGLDLSFDLNNTFSIAAIRLPNNQPIAATNAAQNAVINGLLLDGSNIWQVGGGNPVNVASNQSAPGAGAFLSVENLSTANNITKTVILDFFARDTVNTRKNVGSIQVVPANSNNTADDLALFGRSADTLIEILRCLNGGNVKFSNAASFSANSNIATALTSVGPAGSHTTVQEWLTIVNASGVTRYLPCF